MATGALPGMVNGANGAPPMGFDAAGVQLPGAAIIGAITGRAIYEGKLDLHEAQAYCDSGD